MGFDFAEAKDQGDFNSGLAIIYRMDAYWKACAISYVNKDFINYYKTLVVIFKELWRVMDDKDRKAQYHIYKKNKKAHDQVVDMKRQGKSAIPKELVDCLDEWHLELAGIEQKYNLGMPKKKDPRYAMS